MSSNEGSKTVTKALNPGEQGKGEPNKVVKYFKRMKKELVGFIFVLPVIIGLATLYLPALAQSIKISLSDLTYDNGLQMTFSGFDKYIRALTIDPDFTKTMFDSVGSMLINVPTVVIFSFFIANILNQKFVGRSVSRVVFFLPVIISTGVMYLAEANDTMLMLYNAGKMDVGGINQENIFSYQALKTFFITSGFNQSFTNLVLGVIDKIYYIVTTSGVQILIFLAGLQSIPNSMYEVAKIEGATSWEILWKISFPNISPLMLVTVLFTIIETFYSFSNPIVTFINNNLRDPNQFAYGSALSLIYFGVIAIFIALVWAIINTFIVYSDV